MMVGDRPNKTAGYAKKKKAKKPSSGQQLVFTIQTTFLAQH